MKKEGKITEFVIIILCCVLGLWWAQSCTPQGNVRAPVTTAPH